MQSYNAIKLLRSNIRLVISIIMLLSLSMITVVTLLSDDSVA